MERDLVQGYQGRSFIWASTRLFPFGLLLMILAAGFWLRTMNIRWGLPDTHPYLHRTMEALHPDEQALVQQASELREKGIFHIESLRYPPVHAQITAILAKLSGASTEPQLFLLARGISIAASLGSILLIFFLGLRWNLRTALISSAFLSVAMVSVREAHWANPEPLSSFWVLLAILILFYVRQKSSPVLFMCLGAALALGVASKYFAALFLHLPLLAGLMANGGEAGAGAVWKHYWRNLRRSSGKVILSYVSFGVVIFLCLGIYIVKDVNIFIQAYETHAPWAARNGLYGIFPKPIAVPTYAAAVLPIALGVPLYAACVIGIAISAIKRNTLSLLLIACILPFWIFLELIQYHPLRFCLSLAPVLCLLAAVCFDVGTRDRRRWLSKLAGAAMGATLLYSAAFAYGFIKPMRPQNDSRLLATEWLEKHDAQTKETALLGVDGKANSLGFIQYEGMDRVAGNPYPVLDSQPEYIVVLENVGHILRQHQRLTQAGYRYSAEDWYPMVAPSPGTLELFHNLSVERGYRRVGQFSGAPRFGDVEFRCDPLKFDLALTNMDISIYKRKQPY